MSGLDELSERFDELSERHETALRLVRMGSEDGGRVLPSQIPSRPNATRKAFLDAQANGWLYGDGWVTPAGLAALKEDEAS